jgi:multicomponent Na+:H+ antiporter subunit D
MVIVPAVMVLGALVVGLIPGAVPAAEGYAAQFVDHRLYGAWVLHGARVALPHVVPSHVSAADYGYGAITILGTLGIAAAGLFGYRLRELRESRGAQRLGAAVWAVRGLHSGHIGDYIAWWSAGVGVIGGLCLVVLR